MKNIMICAGAAACLFAASAAFASGAPKPEHPCYDVADCKTQGSPQDFSACIKANVEEANANAACVEFRQNKQAYLEKHGIESVDALFEAD